ncbi:hypothetical protein T4B_4319 [Trichinella pseudospiralis]|uniref:Uncharacterized protein n=1 Tax=Trichinella pseudospiralis TaxID=6337 RepID=A0A0V1GLC7_TRIPS|nr:hypothetical protein T4B_5541 [Trichinella pseudospiralis]KRY99087.1 hypothetical protein T4B_4319 [Trichinella pseudospiralis]
MSKQCADAGYFFHSSDLSPDIVFYITGCKFTIARNR